MSGAADSRPATFVYLARMRTDMAIITSVLGALVTFAVGLLAGGLGVYVGARLVAGEGDFWTAVWTALFGSLAWAVATLLVGWVPLLGSLLGLVLGLLLYLGVISVQYDVDFAEAAAIAFVAWITVVVVRLFLSPLLGPFGAIGVPFA